MRWHHLLRRFRAHAFPKGFNATAPAVALCGVVFRPSDLGWEPYAAGDRQCARCVLRAAGPGKDGAGT